MEGDRERRDSDAAAGPPEGKRAPERREAAAPGLRAAGRLNLRRWEQGA